MDGDIDLLLRYMERCTGLVSDLITVSDNRIVCGILSVDREIKTITYITRKGLQLIQQALLEEKDVEPFIGNINHLDIIALKEVKAFKPLGKIT